MGGPIETQLLINNKLVAASDKGTFDLFSPHTGELVAKGILTINPHPIEMG
jgi:aldehyde dehydrogenase (NAD+)